MVQPEPDFYVAHRHEHERACDEEQRELPALVPERKTALVTHDGVHHRETGAEPSHQPLDEHEPGDDTCNGRGFDVDGERGLVAHAGLVFLLLEKDNADDKVKKARPDKVRLAFGDARVQKGTEANEKDESRDDGKHDGDFDFVMEQAHDVHVQHAHESGNGVFGAHRESDGNVGKTAGDGYGRRDGLELRILEVGADCPEGSHHKDQQPVVKPEMKVQFFQH